MNESTGDLCQCTSHTGFHWLYEDYRWFERNLGQLEQCAKHIQDLVSLSLPPEEKSGALYAGRRERQGSKVAYRTFILEERARWQVKLRYMEVSSIDHISYEVLGPRFADLNARKRALIVRIRDVLLQMVEAEERYAGR